MIKNIKTVKFLFAIFIPVFLFFSNQAVLAKTELGGLDNTAKGAGYKVENMESKQLPEIIGFYINSVLSLLGIVFMALVMWGAFDISGAGGNEEVVKDAKARIKNGAIGILIILTAFFITKAFIDFVSQGVFNLNY